MSDEKQKTTVYLPPEVAQALKLLAKQNRRSFNSEVIVALEEHLARSLPHEEHKQHGTTS